MRNFLAWLVRSIFLPEADPMKRFLRRWMDTERCLRKAVRWDATARSLDEAGFGHLARRSRAVAELYRRRAGVASRPGSSRAA
jgi:hypothetical protein